MGAVTTALVAVGSNLASIKGTPAATAAAGLEALGRLGRVTARSRLWRSPAWPPGGPDYVNAAARVETAFAPEDLLARLHGIEAAMGRDRRRRWGNRTLDLDLLAVGGLVRPDAAAQAAWRGLDPARQALEAPGALVLPHPRMQDRGFVLLPLSEVAPGWRHPLLGLTVAEMLAGLPPAALDGLAALD